MVDDRGHPSGRTDFVSDQSEKFIIICAIILQELLGKCLGFGWQLVEMRIGRHGSDLSHQLF
jgi:hypothetical protein